MLTVLSVSYPLALVHDDVVGGAEQVLAALDRALVAAGHRSIVIAPQGSRCRGELLATVAPSPPFDTAAIHACHHSCRRQIARALEHEAVDVIHMHGVDFIDYMPDVPALPILATLHLWPTVYRPRVFAPRPNLHLRCVSSAQLRACPRAAAASVIPNGVDVATYFSATSRGDFALVLGRICPEKGVHLAIDAARAARIPLVIAGEVFPYPEHAHYFATHVAPRLGDGVRFVGPLRGRAKRCALANARCLLLPSLAPETSSLSAMEALASGTPVVALRSPALEELIDDGRTGALIDDPARLTEGLARVAGVSPEACRAAAAARCSIARTTREYLATYERLAFDARCARRSAPGAESTSAAEA